MLTSCLWGAFLPLVNLDFVNRERELAELDLVAPDPETTKGLLVAEVTWRRLSARERHGLLRELQAKWARSALAPRHPKVRFEILDAGSL